MQTHSDVLRVLEHERISVDSARRAGDRSITEEESDWLIQLNEDRPGFCTREYKRVRFAQFCGIVRLPTRTIEILPKVSVNDPDSGFAQYEAVRQSRNALLSMLRYVSGFPFTQIGTAPQNHTDMPLMDVFIQHFLKEVAAMVKRGLLVAYVEHEDNLPFLRGRFTVTQHLRTNHRRPDRVYCSYDELTADNEHNQVVRHVLSIVRGWIHSHRLQQLWLELWPFFLNFREKVFTADHVAAIPRERLAHHYESLMVWSEWLLSLKSPALLAGKQHAPALLFNMNALFEAYVTECVRGEYRAEDTIVESHGVSHPLAFSNMNEDTFFIEPDVTVRRRVDGTRILIVDAKWKMLDPAKEHWGVSVSDMYQMLAYAVGCNCHSIRLAYPWLGGIQKPQNWPEFKIPVGLSELTSLVKVGIKLYPLAGIHNADIGDQ